MPDMSLVSSWMKSAHKLWVNRLQRTSSLPELLQVHTHSVFFSSELIHADCTTCVCRPELPLMRPMRQFYSIMYFRPGTGAY